VIVPCAANATRATRPSPKKRRPEPWHARSGRERSRSGW
jgi:hypothetical protein